MGMQRQVAHPMLRKREAQEALAKAVGDHFRQTGEPDPSILAQRVGDAIVVAAYFAGGEAMSVLIPVTDLGWNPHVEAQLVHEFITVCRKRIDLERFCSQYMDARTREAANAYR